MGSTESCSGHTHKTTALKRLCSKYKTTCLWHLIHVPILLELSVVFDTIDHTILLRCLHDLGIRGAAFYWLDPIWDNEDTPLFSMVHCHHIKICLFKCLRDRNLAQYYSPYIHHRWLLGAMAREYHISFHFYADGTQLYFVLKPNNTESFHQIIGNIPN